MNIAATFQPAYGGAMPRRLPAAGRRRTHQAHAASSAVADDYKAHADAFAA